MVPIPINDALLKKSLLDLTTAACLRAGYCTRQCGTQLIIQKCPGNQGANDIQLWMVGLDICCAVEPNIWRNPRRHRDGQSDRRLFKLQTLKTTAITMLSECRLAYYSNRFL